VPDKRNILFILTDQHRADAIGCYGNEICQTPNLDRLASEATVFERAYTTCSLCSPARGSLMSGQYPHTFGLLNNVEAPGSDMKEIERRPYMNPEVLKREGYNLGYAGKWHLGEKVLPRDFGFEGDNFPGHGGGGMDYPEFHAYLAERGLDNPYPERSERRSYFSGLLPGPVTCPR
jgi:arylsulfatase A-like enzyme